MPINFYDYNTNIRMLILITKIFLQKKLQKYLAVRNEHCIFTSDYSSQTKLRIMKQYAIMNASGAVIVYARSKKEAHHKFQEHGYIHTQLKDVYLY